MNKPRATTAGVARGGCKRTREQRTSWYEWHSWYDNQKGSRRKWRRARKQAMADIKAHKHGGTHEQG
jgi:hypothetical protein